MNINGSHYETIWLKDGDNSVVQIIDQRFLPFKFLIHDLKTADDVFFAIKDMYVRGAPLIGAAAGLGVYLALLNFKGNTDLNKYIDETAGFLKSSRPTAINLAYAVDRMTLAIKAGTNIQSKTEIAYNTAIEIVNEERQNCINIGQYGLPVIEEIAKRKKNKTVNILTHCNAGWLACIDYGTATAPIYMAHDKGIDVHVWVDETRPRNQGSKLTAWELLQHGVPCTIITDNAGGHLMQHDMVDLVIVGCDRASVNGDVANKVGTYLKALAANDNNVPFYVALPSSSFDWTIHDGVKEIPIEERDADEIKRIQGMKEGELTEILITDKESKAANYGFDVTPARLITGLITEKGICKPGKNSISELFPEKTQITAL